MLLQQTLQAIELLDSASICGNDIAKLFAQNTTVDTQVAEVVEEKGKTDFIRILISGKHGKTLGGSTPTLGIIGRLGGIGARPNQAGLVSDADGAVAIIAAAIKLNRMLEQGDQLDGDIILTTHICPNAPTRPHFPVDFMDSPISMETMNNMEVDPQMDAILSLDTTKGNRILNHKGIAISPTVKSGWILPVSADLLRIQETVTGVLPTTFPISQQDITPYSNGLYHLNSIVQPSTATSSPVVGVAICTQSIVPGCSTGASHEIDIALAAAFAIEVAKAFSKKQCQFYDPKEFEQLENAYGKMERLQK